MILVASITMRPNGNDVFPSHVTFPNSNASATLLVDSEVPQDDWRIVSYQLHQTGAGKSPRNSDRMVFAKKTAPIWSITYPHSSGMAPGPWYRIDTLGGAKGCLRTFWDGPVGGVPESTELSPARSRPNWLTSQLENRVCGFVRKGNALTVYLSDGNTERDIFASMTFTLAYP